MPPVTKRHANKTKSGTEAGSDEILHKIIEKTIAKPKTKKLLRNAPQLKSEEKRNCNKTAKNDLKIREILPNDENSSETKAIAKAVHKPVVDIRDIVKQNPALERYWNKRYSLFSFFDDGIQLDAEGLYSVTPEKVAEHHAKRMACNVIIDGFCGCGGNTIQFAMTCDKVIAIDIDPNKIEMARNNARIYGVSEKIEFVVGDFLVFCKSGCLQGDVVFLSPPWGGPKYLKVPYYDIEENLRPIGASKLMELARKVSKNIALFLPKNSKSSQIKALVEEGKKFRKERNHVHGKTIGLTAYYGEYFNKENTKEEN